MLRYLRTASVLVLMALLVAPGLIPASSTYGLAVETVEVSEDGFNPGVCRMNREFVQFRNVGSSTIRIGKPGVTPGDPPFDIRVIAPGGVSPKTSIPYGGTTEFIDLDRPGHSLTVVTPVFVMYWDPICTPDPDFSPPQPPCRGNEHCLRMPVVAVD